MEKQFAVSVDITMSKTIYVNAQNEDEALELARKKVQDNPYELAASADAYVSHEVFDAYEVDD